MPKQKPPPFVAYRGRLSFEGDSWPIYFQVRGGADGELIFRVRPMPLTKETWKLNEIWSQPRQRLPFFKLEGVSRSGRRFHSDTIVMKGISLPLTHIQIKLGCSKGVFRQETDGSARPFIRFHLIGFQALPELQATCALGEITMQGRYPAPKTHCLSGLIQIVAVEPPEDFEAWRLEAERLCHHLLLYMGFASSRTLNYPVQLIWDGTVYEEVRFSQIKHTSSAQPVFHPMKSQAIFERVVAAFFDPPIELKNPGYPIEWFAMGAAYTETRLLNVMTALENLTDSNLPKSQMTFMPASRFKTIASRMKNGASELVDSLTVSTNAERDDLNAFLSALSSKMPDLNRRPFRNKLLALADKWNVPISDLASDEGLGSAIAARNNIVHRGWYYEPDAGSAEARDLWDHVLLMREIFIRFILTALAYEGEYLSFRGGENDVVFPPPRK